MKKLILTAAFAALSLSTAFAQDVNGVWLRDNGNSKVRFAPCGDSICGTVTWTKAPQKDDKNPDEAKRNRSVTGVQVFFGMKPNGANAWSGKAYNPEDGKTYTGKMSLSGDKLTTQGCALGGMICKSAGWSRAS
jgi:uncharacterized protein (DUF2147 family)